MRSNVSICWWIPLNEVESTSLTRKISTHKVSDMSRVIRVFYVLITRWQLQKCAMMRPLQWKSSCIYYMQVPSNRSIHYTSITLKLYLHEANNVIPLMFPQGWRRVHANGDIAWLWEVWYDHNECLVPHPSPNLPTSQFLLLFSECNREAWHHQGMST